MGECGRPRCEEPAECVLLGTPLCEYHGGVVPPDERDL